MTVNAKKLFYILIGINIVLVAATCGTFVLANNIAASKSNSIAVTKADIEGNSSTINNLQTLQKTVAKNREIEAISKAVLPQDSQQSVALAELEKFSQNSGISIKQISFTPGKGGSLISPTNLKGVSVLSVNVHYNAGRYEQLLNLLKQIEDNRRRMQVTSIALTPSETVAGKLDRIDLTLDLYLKP